MTNHHCQLFVCQFIVSYFHLHAKASLRHAVKLLQQPGKLIIHDKGDDGELQLCVIAAQGLAQPFLLHVFLFLELLFLRPNKWVFIEHVRRRAFRGVDLLAVFHSPLDHREMFPVYG